MISTIIIFTIDCYPSHLAGIPIGSGPMVPMDDRKYLIVLDGKTQIRGDIIHRYFPGIEPNCSDSCGVKVSSLNKWFEAIKLNTVIVGAEDTARAFLFFLCGTYFFPDRKRQRSYWLVGCFGGFGDCGIIRLGFVILVCIYYSLHLLSIYRVDSMNCFWQLILVSVKK